MRCRRWGCFGPLGFLVWVFVVGFIFGNVSGIETMLDKMSGSFSQKGNKKSKQSKTQRKPIEDRAISAECITWMTQNRNIRL